MDKQRREFMKDQIKNGIFLDICLFMHHIDNSQCSNRWNLVTIRIGKCVMHAYNA